MPLILLFPSLNARSLAPRDLAPTMGQDEYSEDRRGGLALEALVVPALVLFASICAAFTMSSKSMSLSKAYAFASELTEKNQILQAFIGSSLLGVFSYSLMLAGRTLISTRGLWGPYLKGCFRPSVFSAYDTSF